MDLEYRIIRPDGNVRVIHDTSYLQKDTHFGRSFIVGRCKDVTSLHQTQSALSDQVKACVELKDELQKRDIVFRELAEHIDEVFWIRDIDDDIVQYVSPAYERVWGRPQVSLADVSREWYAAIDNVERKNITNLFCGAVEKRVYTRNYNISRPQGEIRTICERAFPITDRTGRIRRLVGLAQDITEARQAEEDRLNLVMAQAARRNAEAQVVARDQALAIVAHDLRNPLAAISIALSRLAKPIAEEKKFGCIANAQRSIERMGRLLNDLLDVSSMEAGSFSLNYEDVSIRDFISEALADFSDWPGCEDVSITGEIAPDVPSTFRADRFRVLQALTNLVGNAVKFTPKGGRITLKVKKADNGLIFVIEDTGVGITKAAQQHLFDPFWQVNSADRRGVGLGLSIVKGIVTAHKGTIAVESDINSGTQFTIQLPLASN